MDNLIKKLDEDLYTVEYKWFDGAWTFRDSFIIEFVKKLRRPDLIFYNVEDLDKWNPLSYFRSVRLWFGFNKQEKCVGAFWISSPNNLNRSGWFNCGMVKDVFSSDKDYIRTAHLGLKDLLNRPDVETLYGETSITNKPILMLADYFGFVKLGVVPNGHWHAKDKEFCDTVVMYINRHSLRKTD